MSNNTDNNTDDNKAVMDSIYKEISELWGQGLDKRAGQAVPMAFPYYGGKGKQRFWLGPLLPVCDYYIEPFCGAATMMFYRQPSHVDVINDIDGDVVNFFRMLRDNSTELINKLRLTPYAKDELWAAEGATSYPVERARRFYVRCKLAMQANPHLVPQQWKYSTKKNTDARTKKSLARTYCHLQTNLNKSVEYLPKIVNRLKCVQIDNRPAVDVIKRYDSKDSLIYCDPPYMPTTCDTRHFGKHEMSVEDHEQLCKVLLACVGKVAISGHRCELYDDMFRDWQLHTKSAHVFVSQKPDNRRTDCLWTNYPVDTNTDKQ